MLILTEKPSVAKAFAEALGVQRKGGFWESDDYCIVNALGHLLEDYNPEDYNPALKKWTLEALPIIPAQVQYKVIEKTAQQLAVVKKCFDAHKDEDFLLATDAEREGELIGAEILDYAGFKDYGKARRFWVSEALTKDVVLQGIKDAKPLSDYESYKIQGYARQHADWLIGMNLTRLVSIKCGKTLTVGRVQSAVLKAIYDREKAIAAFIKEKYVEVAASLDAGHPFSAKLINQNNEEFPTRFLESAPLLKEIEAKKADMKNGRITSLSKEKKTVHPPQLFNLTALQKEAHKKYSLAPEQTLNIAQVLYEKHKCMSYPRTPSRVMGDENVELVRGIYNKLKDTYTLEAQGSLEENISTENKRLFNSAELQDHHALIPLAPIPEEASDEEKKVFSLVVKQFFNTLKSDYIYNAIKIAVDISNFAFQGSGIELLQQGWKEAQEKDEDEEEHENYSGLQEGSEYPVKSINREEKFTEPKKHYTYASLLQLMENPRNEEGKRLTGLGTPATRGSILEKLINRKYIEQKGKNILIAEDGKFLIDNLNKNELLAAFISIPETTRWEEELHDESDKFLEGVKDFVRKTVATTNVEKYQIARQSLGKCPLCSGEVYEYPKSYSCSNYKDKDCKFAIWKEVSGAAVSAADAQALLAGKKTKLKKCKSKAGNDFNAAFFLEDDKVKFQFENKKK
jgi:DNA topoisomerase-3